MEFGQTVAHAFFQDKECPECRAELNCHPVDSLDDSDEPSFFEAWEDLNLDSVMDSFQSWDTKKFW